jgi:hypothetical protein
VQSLVYTSSTRTSVVVDALEQRQFQREHNQVVLGGGVAESFSLFGGLRNKKNRKVTG